MRCPTCKQPVPSDRREFLPFCSQRCKLVDLGRWLDGSYVVPGEPADDEDLESAEQEPADRDRSRH